MPALTQIWKQDVKRPNVCTTTGYAAAHLPPGPDRDAIIEDLRLAWKFITQHQGRRPGFLANEIDRIARKIGAPITFERVLEEMESAAVRRDRDGEGASAFERVNRVWSVVTYHDPRSGSVEVTFATIRNKVTACKKMLPAEFLGCAKP